LVCLLFALRIAYASQSRDGIVNERAARVFIELISQADIMARRLSQQAQGAEAANGD